jgi:hypothetical protein
MGNEVERRNGVEVDKKEGGGEKGNSEMVNFMKERKKEEHEWKEKFENLEQRYDLLANTSQSSGKVKIVLGENLFQEHILTVC